MDTYQTEPSITILGLMTGSSADGLDICLVKFTGSNRTPDYDLLVSHEIPYPKRFQECFRNPLELSDPQITELDLELGQWFASEIEMLNLNFDLIASHGQTIKHEPPHFTLQIGEPRYMATRFNCPVIYDFRTADINLGGQGAPLIPIVDQYLLQQESADVLALNIGGIANLTIVPARENAAPLLAWDTGPGNTLMDKAVRQFTSYQLDYDKNGDLAAEGTLDLNLLDGLLKHEFYERQPPRSAGQEQFGNTYFQHILKKCIPETDQEWKDLIYTLTVLTAKTIAGSIHSLPAEYKPSTMVVGGGGTFNKTLMDRLRAELPAIVIRDMNISGINQRNKEAFGFAYLGYLYTQGLTGNLPSVTGARRAVTLGKLCDPQTD